MLRKTLLACGIVSSLLYVAMNVLVPMQWDAYSSFSQTISELSAIDTPTRPLWVPLGIVYTLLIAAFGLGVWKSAHRNRLLRLVGGLFVASGLIGLGWLPMHQRAVLAAGGATLSDTMHIVWSVVTVALMMFEIGFAAAAFDRRFRRYSIATMVVLFVFGMLTFWSAPGVAANLPTPWLGVWERINVLGFMLWQAVLAIALLRHESSRSQLSSAEPLSDSPIPRPFKTTAGEAAYLSAYDAGMKLWPVPYEEMDISSRFGLTHVVVSGPKDAPPLVLLHGYWATLIMWTPNVADFSKVYRVYAVDIMGQPSKSIPDEPIRNAADYVAWLTATLNGLHLDRVSLVGMSYGGWLALTYAVAAPVRVQKLVLLSPAASVLPIVRQFSLRGMLMLFLPTHFTVNSFMRWLGIKDNRGDSETRRVGDNIVDLMYLGLKHFRMSQEVMPTVFADSDLRALHVPTLLLLGDREVIYDPATALARARRLLPDFQGDLVPGSSHDMCFSQNQLVDARILDFLRKKGTDDQDKTIERSVA
jgi:pimeloyl-ACP methyl ester carboxylesterase